MVGACSALERKEAGPVLEEAGMPKAERKCTARVIYPIVAAVAILQGGCLLAVPGVCAGGAAAGYFYYKGRICRDYPASLPNVYTAAQAALNDLHFVPLAE